MSWTLITIVALGVAGATSPPDSLPPYSVGIQAPQRGPLSPSLAAGLSGWAPAVLGVPTGMVSNNLFLALGATASGFGAGHVYAGEPRRGAMVSLGGALLLGVAGGLGHYYDSQPRDCPMGGCLQPVEKTLAYPLVAAIAYSLWASTDARLTAERRNLELTGWHAPMAAPVE